ncbi:GGDEF domain-containing protein [Piscinibacter sp. XHJ-5]|uniref:GGDEF domain-containing protein n=1 Tax=Piscinibacter sp. XHJ-5 TaxID=3037797 RepID=UPI00245283C9|nr:GGDEF domain-containing protein [Piscinibacter sp. XHJ-5]
MSELVEHLAELTGFRDRDVLDVTLAGAFRDLLHPRSVAIYRMVGDGDNKRWLTRARLSESDAVATADPVWVDLDSLPALSQHPARCEALTGQTVVTHEGGAGLAVFPLATDREVVGVLELVTEGPLQAEAQRMVCSILRIYRNFQGLLDYSERDTLTGLLNRKTFDESFLKISSMLPAPSPSNDPRRAAGPGSRYWLGMIDIDHFKTVNDSYGHLIGDEVLLLLSRLMRSSFRFHDRLYRFGGEEFVVLMRCDTDTDAKRAFERLRSNTLAYSFPQVGHITVSIGFSELRSGDSPSSAIERADKAVYWAKTHGRNQVQSHAELIARGELEVSEKIGDVELF